MRAVRGHGLLNEGTGYKAGQPIDIYLTRLWLAAHDVAGVGICRCGAVSDPLPSDAARRRWHREHKLAVLAGRVAPWGNGSGSEPVK